MKFLGIIIGGLLFAAVMLTVMQTFGQLVAPHDRCEKGEIALAVWYVGYWCTPGYQLEKRG